MSSGLKILVMTPDIKELVDTLDELIIELEKFTLYGPPWAAWMLKAKRLIQQKEFTGILYILNAYHGTGSINDALSDTEYEPLAQKLYYQAERIKNAFESENFLA